MGSTWRRLSQEDKQASYEQSRPSARRRACQAREQLADRYIKTLLGSYRHVPQELIRAKRAQIRLKRALNGVLPPPNKLVRLLMEGIACEKRLRVLIGSVSR